MGGLLEAKALVKRYGRRTILDGVDLTVEAGSLVGIEGENGAGKSTLLKCLVGLLRPDSGHVTAAGRVGYCPQEPALFELLTIREQLLLCGAGYGLTRAEVTSRGDELMSEFGCLKYGDTRIDRLSGGTKQKANLIAAVLARPAVLVLDEPYQGFDHETYLAFWEHAARARSTGSAVLVVSHMHADRDRFDEMVVLRDGKAAHHV